jgi:7-carboxy-7-deazaguanine synthase
MIINEIFYSLQGEGLLAGTPSIFIRLAGCPLRCKWCDTKYAWDASAGQDFTVSQILDQIKKYSCNFVVVTGGEPMVNSVLPELVKKLKATKKHITIETAGLAFISDLPCDFVSISPKLSNSFSKNQGPNSAYKYTEPDISVLKMLIDNYDYQLKFVVDSPDDLDEILRTVDRIGNVRKEKVLLMPQAATRDELLAKSPMVADLCKRSGFVFCQRLQIMLWNNEKAR